MSSDHKQHVKHGWVQRDTSHIHNVGYLLTHRLMLCPCGFFGWVEEGLFNDH